MFFIDICCFSIIFARRFYCSLLICYYSTLFDRKIFLRKNLFVVRNAYRIFSQNHLSCQPLMSLFHYFICFSINFMSYFFTLQSVILSTFSINFQSFVHCSYLSLLNFFKVYFQDNFVFYDICNILLYFLCLSVAFQNFSS